MALEKCMQRREAASTNNNNITTTATITATATSNTVDSLSSTITNATSATTTTTTTKVADVTGKTSSSDLPSPDVSLHLQLDKGPEMTSTPQKSRKTDSSHEMEVSETTETETSMDTSAEINHTSDMCESQESEASIKNTAAKTIMEIYEEKPLDFTKSPTKKSKDKNNPAKNVETCLRSTAVVNEKSKEKITAYSKNENAAESKENDNANKASSKKEN